MTIKSTFYLDLWRAAWNEPVEMLCANHKEANAVRLRMYVAARPYRQDPNKDFDLHTKLLSLEAVVKDHEDGTATLIVRPEWLNERLMRLSAQTGIPLGPQQADAEASMQRVLDRLQNSESEERREGVDKKVDWGKIKEEAEKSGG